MISLLAAVWTAAKLPTYEVVAVERHSAFAGKLGVRVTERLTLEINGKTLYLALEPYHTRCARPDRPLKTGDKIAVRLPSTEGEALDRADLRVVR